MIRAHSLWLFCFTILFFLALDFWSWSRPITLSWLNFPVWVLYFMGLQIVLAIALVIFVLTFWRSSSGKEG